MTPLTYQGANGKQYVAAVAGSGDAAFHIPREAEPVGQRDGCRVRPSSNRFEDHMDRREFFQTSLIASAGRRVLGDSTLARGAGACGPRRKRRQAPAGTARRRRAG